MIEDGLILIGRKPIMNYVTSILFYLKKVKIITIKARGRLISKSIDVIEVLKDFDRSVDYDLEFEIGSSERDRGKKVSFISIKLKKKNDKNGKELKK